ncbi:MAG: MogA/MoaB family molybdenum cofactor biosynthesis protein [Turicibacter sp.]|nr:MogA/MoaB family molybdenum cofactor biosynthesis protein [Turicibacter sp.]
MDLDKKTVAVMTVSDSRSADKNKTDVSGELICKMVKEAGYEVVSYQLISDDFQAIKQTLLHACYQKIALVLTTGGTGLSPRDQTPEATKAILEKEVSGISEAMRHHSMQITPRAMLSRGVSGIRGQSLIINLPGSPKAVRENLSFILPTLHHGLAILQQEVGECAEPDVSDNVSTINKM